MLRSIMQCGRAWPALRTPNRAMPLRLMQLTKTCVMQRGSPASAVAGFSTTTAKNRSNLATWMYERRWPIIANTACSLTLLQWFQEDVLYMRSLNILAVCFFTTYNLKMKAFVYIAWDMCYTTMNMIQISRILKSRKQVEFEVHHEKLWRAAFEHTGLSRMQLTTLVDLGELCTLSRGERLPAGLCMVVDGTADVEVKGERVFKLKSGDFIGECDFIEHTKGFTAKKHARDDDSDCSHPVKIISRDDALTIVCWEEQPLRKLLSDEPRIQNAIQSIAAKQLVHRLQNMDRERGGHSIKEQEQAKKADDVYDQLLKILLSTKADGASQDSEHPESAQQLPEYMQLTLRDVRQAMGSS